MNIEQAVGGLIGAPTYVAMRPRGVMIQVTDGNRVLDIRTAKKRSFQPVVTDILANDWEVFSPAQLKKLLGRQGGQAEGE
jgi:hypothetical protein